MKMTNDIIVLKTRGKNVPKPEKKKPDAQKLISGKYKTTAWNHFTGEDGRLFCGIWESTKGKVAVDYTEWEFCQIISGEVILRREDGVKWKLKKGDAFIIPVGFKGTWETVKKVKKYYVALMPKAEGK
jgi:uncharacterized cupin superfamily protein